MLGKIVKFDYCRELVLGVVISETKLPAGNSFCVISRMDCPRTYSNIKQTKKTKINDLFESGNTSSRFSNDLEVAGTHPECEYLKQKTTEYQEKYQSMTSAEMLKLAENVLFYESLDGLHRSIFLDAAIDKDVADDIYTLTN